MELATAVDQRTRARVDADVSGPRPAAARRARGRAGHAVDRARAHARRALDRLPVLSRGAARRGVDPARRPGCRGRAVRARVHARLLGRRRVLGGLFRPGIGLLDAARGDLDGAIARLEDALARCLRQRDTHTWIRAYVLDALCATATAAKDPRADGWVAELGALAGRCGMREFQVHAYLYRADLGDLDALEAARALAGGVENPHLQGMLDAARPADAGGATRRLRRSRAGPRARRGAGQDVAGQERRPCPPSR